jgi:S-adenosylmethionine:diacylglycerol 3-amino-3-carboxypropyl transferase
MDLSCHAGNRRSLRLRQLRNAGHRRARWQQVGIVYRDNLARIVVDIPDKKEYRIWMKAFKKRWKEKLEQLEIWMISYRIDIE